MVIFCNRTKCNPTDPIIVFFLTIQIIILQFEINLMFNLIAQTNALQIDHIGLDHKENSVVPLNDLKYMLIYWFLFWMLVLV